MPYCVRVVHKENLGCLWTCESIYVSIVDTNLPSPPPPQEKETFFRGKILQGEKNDISLVPEGVLPEILDQGAPQRFLNPNPI